MGLVAELKELLTRAEAEESDAEEESSEKTIAEDVVSETPAPDPDAEKYAELQKQNEALMERLDIIEKNQSRRPARSDVVPPAGSQAVDAKTKLEKVLSSKMGDYETSQDMWDALQEADPDGELFRLSR